MIKILTSGVERSDGYCEGESKRRRRNQSSLYLIMAPEISPNSVQNCFCGYSGIFLGQRTQTFSQILKGSRFPRSENPCAEFSGPR